MSNPWRLSEYYLCRPFRENKSPVGITKAISIHHLTLQKQIRDRTSGVESIHIILHEVPSRTIKGQSR